MRKVLFILGQLSDTDVDWLARSGRRERLARGTPLIRAGTTLDHLYIVLEGRLLVRAPDGTDLGESASGDILGELAFVEAGRTSASVTVAGDEEALVLAVPAALLRRKLAEDMHFSARFHRALALFLAHRLTNTMRRAGLDVTAAAADREDGAEDADAAAPRPGELGATVMDHLHLAGARFDRILRQLGG